MTLTPTGELVLPRARFILHQSSDPEADVMWEECGVTRVVRLGWHPSLSHTILPILTPSSPGLFPGRLEVQLGHPGQLTGGLESGGLDVAIMYDLELDVTWKTAALAELPPPRPRSERMLADLRFSGGHTWAIPEIVGVARGGVFVSLRSIQTMMKGPNLSYELM